MKISLILLLLLTVAALAVGVFRRHWLPGLWLVSLLILPTAQAKIAEAPVYLYDLLGFALIASFLAAGELQLWPRGIPRWHWWLIGAAFVLSVLLGSVRTGFLPDMLWIWGHASLSWMAFAFGIIMSVSAGRPLYRTSMRWALLLSALALSGMAWVQFANLPGSQTLSSLFYAHLGCEQSVEMLRLGGPTIRATGPHFAPTGFAGMGLLCGIAFWLLSEPRHRGLRLMVLGLCTSLVLCTVSRHAMVALLVGLAVLTGLSQVRTKVKILTLTLIAGALICSSALGLTSARESWSQRLSKWQEGLFADDNIAARMVWGPARLMACLVHEPSLLITGAGLDPEKLAHRAHRPLDFESGFVSNGFLLSLYYLGVIGFVLYALFWLWALQIARSFPPPLQAPMCSFVVIAILIVAADNYGFMYEPAVSLLFLLVGLVAGERHHQQIQYWPQTAPEPAPAPRALQGGSCAA